MENFVARHREDSNRQARRQAHLNKTSNYNTAPANPATHARKGNQDLSLNITNAIEKGFQQGLRQAGGGHSGTQAGGGRSGAQAGPNEQHRIDVYVAYKAIKATMEFKEPKTKPKGGKVCAQFITNGCPVGDKCPYYHPSNKNICIPFQTKEGCNKKSCTFSHELIGKTATLALLGYPKGQGQSWPRR